MSCVSKMPRAAVERKDTLGMAEDGDTFSRTRFGITLLRLDLLVGVRGVRHQVRDVSPSEFGNQAGQALNHLLSTHGSQIAGMKNLLANVGEKRDKNRVARDSRENVFKETAVLE